MYDRYTREERVQAIHRTLGVKGREVQWRHILEVRGQGYYSETLGDTDRDVYNCWVPRDKGREACDYCLGAKGQAVGHDTLDRHRDICYGSRCDEDRGDDLGHVTPYTKGQVCASSFHEFSREKDSDSFISHGRVYHTDRSNYNRSCILVLVYLENRRVQILLYRFI